MSVLQQASGRREAAIDAGRRHPRGQGRRAAAMADALVERTAEILAANADDVAGGREPGSPEAMIDRLTLTEARVAAMADGLREIAALPDPVGEVVRGSTLPNGLELRQIRVPFGVVGIIYEARPNVTADAAGICLKSGNAVLLRGSSRRRAPTPRSSRCCATRSRTPACRPTRSSCSTPPPATRSRS